MLRPGDTFERYTIDAAIGQGGMGCVYRAHDARLDRRVALKVISDGAASRDGDAHARLIREARAAAALDHPNAVSIFDVGEIDGAPYVVMELVTGLTLREVMGDASVPAATRVGWLADVARALSAAHRRGLVHRDIKPENVMVREDGVVKVLDFGIARRTAGAADPNAPTQSPSPPTLTREGVKVGTPVYMAPEQIRGDALDGRADQFAWGVLAYELCTGALPWRGAGEPLAAVASILTDEVPSGPLARAGVSPEVEAVLRRALEKRPEDRFATTDDLVRALDAALKGEAPAPRAASPARAAPAVAPPVAPASATLLQRYSTDEVQEVLSRAIEQQEAKRGGVRLGFDDLVSAAREVGVDPEVLREASRELRLRQEASANDGAARDAWIRKKRRKFYRHLGAWAIVSAALLILGLIEHEMTDMLQVGLIWGVFVAFHGLRAFMANEDDWREEREKVDKAERRQRKREQNVERVISEGAAALLKTGEALRRRIDAPPQPPRGSQERARVRVAPTGGAADREAAAEEEAAAAERNEAARRKR
jgi:eukaryotic-like serine/threonine-protein kinase